MEMQTYKVVDDFLLKLLVFLSLIVIMRLAIINVLKLMETLMNIL